MLDDLRTFIGAFFLLVGIVLVTTGYLSPTLTEGFNLNLIVGQFFILFAAVAAGSFFLAARGKAIKK